MLGTRSSLARSLTHSHTHTHTHTVRRAAAVIALHAQTAIRSYTDSLSYLRGESPGTECRRNDPVTLLDSSTCVTPSVIFFKFCL